MSTYTLISDLFLILEIIKKFLGVLILIITLPMGLTAMMLGRCINAVISLFINAFPNKKLLGYSYWEQAKDMLPSFLLSIFMFGIVLSVQLLNLNMWLTIGIQIPTGVISYVALAKLCKFECLEYVINILKGFKRSK